MTQPITIGDLSQITGCHIETIRKYERQQLLPAPERTENGHRRYTPRHIQALNLVMSLKKCGFSLRDIHHLVQLLNQEYAPCGSFEALMIEYSQKIEEKIRELKHSEKLLSEMGSICLKCHVRADEVIHNDCPLMANLKKNPESFADAGK